LIKHCSAIGLRQRKVDSYCIISIRFIVDVVDVREISKDEANGVHRECDEDDTKNREQNEKIKVGHYRRMMVVILSFKVISLLLRQRRLCVGDMKATVLGHNIKVIMNNDAMSIITYAHGHGMVSHPMFLPLFEPKGMKFLCFLKPNELCLLDYSCYHCETQSLCMATNPNTWINLKVSKKSERPRSFCFSFDSLSKILFRQFSSITLIPLTKTHIRQHWPSGRVGTR
jgi:hypothetical protein